MTRDQGQDLKLSRIQYPDVIWTYYADGHDAVAVIALDRSDRDDIVPADISQWPEERVAMPRDANVAGLSRQPRAGDMADRAPESGSRGSFDDHCGNAETCNFHTTD